MKTSLRDVGNSKGMVFPAKLLREMRSSIGDQFEITIRDGSFVVTPITPKPQFTLSELLAKCDPNAPMPDAATEWDSSTTVGNEF